MGVSVIMPTWNRKDLLVKTIENVLSQTLPPTEVIVVDDHSTDGTVQHISELFTHRVIVMTNEGKGPGAARNTGLLRSTGDYIKFFDSDDLMTRNTLESQVDVLKNTGKGCVYCPYFHASESPSDYWQLTDPAILQFNPVPSSRSFQRWMLRGLFVTIPSFLFTRELLTKAGPWRTDITTYEDFDFLWRVTNQEPAPAHTNACAFLYRKHGTQTTGVHFTSTQRDLEKVICFSDILLDLKGRTDITSTDRMIFSGFIEDTLRKNASQPWAATIASAGRGWIHMPGIYLHRILSKLGRMSTRTNWQLMHGPKIDYDQVRTYLKMIGPALELKLPDNKF